MNIRASRFLKFIILFLLALFFISCQSLNYIYPEEKVINANKKYRIEKIPKKYEKVLINGIILEIYSYLEEQLLFEEIYDSLNIGFIILDEYLNFSKEVLKNKKIKWKIYLCLWDFKIKNIKIKFKKEKKDDFLILKNFIFLYTKSENWDKEIITGIAYFFHELSHNYFIFWEKKKKLNLSSWFEEGFAEFIRFKFLEKKLNNGSISMVQEFEELKENNKLLKEIWEFKVSNLMRKYKIKLFFMKIYFKSNEKKRNYILDFWRHYDNLYTISFGVIKTMVEYYGKEKFKEILKMYRDGIEKEKLKEMAEEAIRAKW